MTSQELNIVLHVAQESSDQVMLALMLRTLLEHARDEARNNENAEAAFRAQVKLTP